MIFKKFSSRLIIIHSTIQNFVLSNLSLTAGLEWLVDKINTLTSNQTILKNRLDTIDINIATSTQLFEPANDFTNIEIEYIPGSVNHYSITRVLDDFSFESTDKQLQFSIDHNFGVEPVFNIYTRTNLQDEYEYTIAKVINGINQTRVIFTEESYLKIIFKL